MARPGGRNRNRLLLDRLRIRGYIDSLVMTFVADSMLGKLARWLRILGYDTTYDAFAEDNDLLRQAEAEGRVLLTRDGPLAERAPLGRCIRIAHDGLDDQIAQLVSVVGLDLSRTTFTRCLICNDPIVAVLPEDVADRVPAYVLETQTRFYRCPTCDRIYWRGTHLNRMTSRLEQIRAGVAERTPGSESGSKR